MRARQLWILFLMKSKLEYSPGVHGHYDQSRSNNVCHTQLQRAALHKSALASLLKSETNDSITTRKMVDILNDLMKA